MSTKNTATVGSTLGTILTLGAVALAAVAVDRNRDKLAPMGAKVAKDAQSMGTMIATNAKTMWQSFATFAKKMADGTVVEPNLKPAAVAPAAANAEGPKDTKAA